METLVIVTGGSAGLGRALLAAAPPGSHRVDISRSGPPPEADIHVSADLSDPASWPRVGEVLEALAHQQAWRRVTFVHAAGTVDPIGFAGEVEVEGYTRAVLLGSAATQVLGHRYLAAVRELPGRRELLVVSSGAATTPYPGWSAYGAAKAAGDQWVRSVGAEQELRGGVRVLGVAPGVLDTAMQASIRAAEPDDFPRVERFRAMATDGRLASPSEAAAGLWRILDDPSHPSGTVLDLRSPPGSH